MTTETYRGVRLKVRALKGNRWGYIEQTVNGQPFYTGLGRDESATMSTLRAYVDDAIERPEAYPDYWQPRA